MSRNALIVGINNYNHLNPLTAPAEDAEAIARLLEQYGKFHVTRLHAVKNETNPSGKMSRKAPVSQSQLEAALLNLFNPEGRNVPDTALLFFSGHGLRRDRQVYREGYLAVSDADQREMWGVSLEWLRRLLEKSPVRQQIVWLDCCHAGELLNFEEANPGAKGEARDRFFIAASREYESAYEETSGKHGLLTAALLEALDPRRNGGEATNHSVCDHIRKRFRSTIQQPVFSNFGGSIILTAPAEEVLEPSARVESRGDGECPYKGLDYFDFRGSDPDLFFGREKLTDELLDRVRENNFLAVLGPSGSGKSSVVRAGLIHALKTGHRLSGSENWPVLAMKPVTGERGGSVTGFSDNPLENLARVFVSPDGPDTERALELRQARTLLKDGAEGLADLIRVKAGEGRLVLLIDQFEECFTLVADEEKRTAFFRCLLDALPLLRHQVCLMITMRADFLGKCAEAEYAGLAELVRKHMAVVTPMSEEEIQQAICKPAEMAGLEVPEELTAQMIADVKDSPGSLPLLQYTLAELYREREGDCLTLNAYTRMGGVKGALARRADEIFDAFSPEEQAVARRIFIALTHLGEGSEDTRRQVPLSRLIASAETAKTVEKVVKQLADARLIVTGEVQARGEEDERIPVVDVAHEALIRHWPRLRSWLDEDRDAIRFERRLDAAVDHWLENGKHKNLLWRSPDLDLLETFHGEHGSDMSAEQLNFLKAGLAARRARQRRKRLIWSLAAAVLVLFAGFGWKYAVDQREHAKEQARLSQIANAEKEKAETLLIKNNWFNANSAKKNGDISRSLHFYAKAGKDEKNDAEVRNCILNIQSSLNVSLAYPIQHDSIINGTLLSKDERLILTWSADNTVRLWNSEDGSSAAHPMKHDASVIGAIFNKDESLILSWAYDNTARLWNAKDGSPATKPLKHGEKRIRKERINADCYINGAIFNKDESKILTWGIDDTARLWWTKDGSSAAPPMKHDFSTYGVVSAVFNKDESLILTWSSDNTAKLWNAKDGSLAVKPMKHNRGQGNRGGHALIKMKV